MYSELTEHSVLFSDPLVLQRSPTIWHKACVSGLMLEQNCHRIDTNKWTSEVDAHIVIVSLAEISESAVAGMSIWEIHFLICVYWIVCYNKKYTFVVMRCPWSVSGWYKSRSTNRFVIAIKIFCPSFMLFGGRFVYFCYFLLMFLQALSIIPPVLVLKGEVVVYE